MWPSGWENRPLKFVFIIWNKNSSRSLTQKEQWPCQPNPTVKKTQKFFRFLSAANETADEFLSRPVIVPLQLKPIKLGPS